MHGKHDTYESDKSKVHRLLLRREERDTTLPDRKVSAMALQDGQATCKGHRHR